MNKQDLTIFKSFEDICRKIPSAPFLISPSRNQKGMTTFTYQETFEKANKISTIFLDKGYGNNLRVATLLGSTPAHYIIKLALNKIGVSVVPINPDYSPDETAYLLADSGSVLAICTEHYIKQLKTAIAYKNLLHQPDWSEKSNSPKRSGSSIPSPAGAISKAGFFSDLIQPDNLLILPIPKHPLPARQANSRHIKRQRIKEIEM